MATYGNGSCISYWAPWLTTPSTKCNLNPTTRKGLLSIYFLGLDLNLKENSQSFPYLTLLIWFSWSAVIFSSLPYAMPIIPPTKSNISCLVFLQRNTMNGQYRFGFYRLWTWKEDAEWWRRVMKLRWMETETWVDCGRDHGDGRGMRVQ